VLPEHPVAPTPLGPGCMKRPFVSVHLAAAATAADAAVSKLAIPYAIPYVYYTYGVCIPYDTDGRRGPTASSLQRFEPQRLQDTQLACGNSYSSVPLS
jgi:hypothetical protein